MSMHLKPMTPEEESGLRAHGLPVGTPSQLADAFRFGVAWADKARAEPQPDADGWINPNDKTRKQYLPHIGERVLFCHAGITYYGKHTGGSFQSFNPPRTFGTWDCLWMYPPKAREAQP